MKKLLFEQVKKSFKAVIPIVLIVLIISVLNVDSDLPNLLPSFILGAFLLVIGMTFFDIGADISMIEIGSRMGNHLTRKRNIGLILFLSFIIGYIITVAEPDLNVLATQIPSVDSDLFINVVGIGVGLFLLFATLRMLLKLSFPVILTIFCGIAFILAIFAPSEFMPLAFDAGGVTTGPLSVPFIVALGAGLSYSRHDKNKKDDSFGIISFCSIGPVIIVLILGIIYNAESTYHPYVIPTYDTILSVFEAYLSNIPSYFKEVLLSLLPITVLFLIYNFIFLKVKKKTLRRIIFGLVYTLIGLTLFLTGINVGFMPMGYTVGKILSSNGILLVLVSTLLGYFIVTSEPAVDVLTEQIEQITNGNIKKRILDVALSIAVAIATGLSLIRLLTGISIWYFLLPGYLFAILMMPFVPKVFTSIAFDSGGVASGTMTATFILPIAIGACEALGGNVLTDAFGVIAMVATVPLITVQVVGLIYKIKSKITYNDTKYNEEIIDY